MRPARKPRATEPARHIWHGTCGHDWDFTETDLAALHSGERAKPVCPTCPVPGNASVPPPVTERSPDAQVAELVDMVTTLNAKLHTARVVNGVQLEFGIGHPNGEQIRILNIQKPRHDDKPTG